MGYIGYVYPQLCAAMFEWSGGERERGEGGREGRKRGGREGGREGRKRGGREGGREGGGREGGEGGREGGRGGKNREKKREHGEGGVATISGCGYIQYVEMVANIYAVI